MSLRDTVNGCMGAGKTAILGTANAAYGVTAFVKRHVDQVDAVVRGAVGAAGGAIKVSGRVVSGLGSAAEHAAHQRAATSASTAGRLAGHGAQYVGTAIRLVGLGVRKTGELTGRTAPAVGGLVGGVTTGATAMVSDALDSFAITDADIARLRVELATYGDRLRARSDARMAEIRSAQRRRNKSDLIDTLVVGGMTMSEVLRTPGHVPAEIQQAFALQYPDLASTETFAQAVQHASPDQLVGLVDGVKGKLFELKLVDHLNQGGNLPPGFHAVLAHGATQPGWDLKVLDPNGHVADLIQAKATQSADYVRQALERYPDIHVTTTHGVYAHLMAMGMGQHVSDSGISLHQLTGDVAHAATAASAQFHGISFVPSTLSLAIIGLSVLMDKRETWALAGRQFGDRSAKAGVSVGAAKAALVVTQTWWIGLIAGVGSRMLAAYGGRKRERYQQLVDVLDTLRPLMATSATPA